MTETRLFPRPVFARPVFARLAATLAAAALLAATPIGISFGAAGFTVKDSVALAGRGQDDGASGGHFEAPGDDHGAGGSDDRGADDHKKKKDKKKGKKNKPVPPTDDSVLPGPVVPVKVERSANEIEVRYSDGTKEEIEYGRYERKNAAGRTVEQRPATQADIDRLSAY